MRLPLPDLQPAQGFGYHYGAFDLALSPDGRRAVTGGHDRSLVLWNLKRSQHSQPLPPQDSRISTVSVIDGNRAITSLENGTIQIWDLSNGQLLASAALDDSIRQLAVSREGRIAIARLSTERIVELDLTALNAESWRARQGRRTAVAVTPEGRIAFAGSTRNVLTRFDVQPELDPSGVQSRIVATCINEGGRLSFSGDWSGTVTTINVTFQPPRESLFHWRGGIDRMGVTPNGRRVVWGLSDRSIIVWEGLDHQPRSVTWGGGMVFGSIFATPTGLVVATHRDGEISYGDVESDMWGQWDNPNILPDRVLCAAAPDERSRVLGTQDGSYIVQDRDGGTLRVAVHKSSVKTVAVTPDGAIIVSGAGDGTVAVWQPHLSAPPRVVPGHVDSVKIVAIAPDGTFAVSGSTADDLTLWALPELRPVAGFQCDGRIEDVALSASASLVVVADGAGGVHLLAPMYGKAV